MTKRHTIASTYSPTNTVTLFRGDCVDLLATIPDESMHLVVTSPPYNIGKEYETRLHLGDYVAQQRTIIAECVRTLHPRGHICWQVGNYTDAGTIVPLDTILYPVFTSLGLRMRNRIIWHFEHGLHCQHRFSGRYETIMWFTKTDDYYFNLDPVRIPQKYPGKRYFKGPNAGKYSCNPLGKNPGDVWVFPNVKSNHVEKTIHPCQFPVELVQRLILSLTQPGDSVFDPFLGVGSTICAAILLNRTGHGAEILPRYVAIARDRINRALQGALPFRQMNTPVFDPKNAGARLTTAPWLASLATPSKRTAP